jgi:hypothetical protein
VSASSVDIGTPGDGGKMIGKTSRHAHRQTGVQCLPVRVGRGGVESPPTSPVAVDGVRAV